MFFEKQIKLKVIEIVTGIKMFLKLILVCNMPESFMHTKKDEDSTPVNSEDVNQIKNLCEYIFVHNFEDIKFHFLHQNDK